VCQGGQARPGQPQGYRAASEFHRAVPPGSTGWRPLTAPPPPPQAMQYAEQGAADDDVPIEPGEEHVGQMHAEEGGEGEGHHHLGEEAEEQPDAAGQLQGASPAVAGPLWSPCRGGAQAVQAQGAAGKQQHAVAAVAGAAQQCMAAHPRQGEGGRRPTCLRACLRLGRLKMRWLAAAVAEPWDIFVISSYCWRRQEEATTEY